MRSYAKAFVLTVYAFGTTIVVVLSAVFLARVDWVPFPNAMLPMQLWEMARDCLAVGTLPMVLAAWGMVRAIDANRKKARILLLLPVLPCFGSLFLLEAVWLTGLFFAMLFWRNARLAWLTGLSLGALLAVVIYSVKNIRQGRWKRALLVIGIYFLVVLIPYFVVAIRYAMSIL